MRKSLLKICVGLAFVSAAVFSGVAAPGLMTLHGHVPAAVSRLQPTGSLPATTNLHLAIGLPLRNQEALSDLLREIYDPSSPHLPSLSDAGRVHGPVWTHGAGLSKGD